MLQLYSFINFGTISVGCSSPRPLLFCPVKGNQYLLHSNAIYRLSLNVYGDQTVNVSTARRWVTCFSSGDSYLKDKPRSGRPYTAVRTRNEESLHQLIRTNWWITTREQCTEMNIDCNALKRWWQRWKIAKFVPGGSDEC